MLESKNGGKLLGFHGRAGPLLNAIGPHFFAFNYPLTHFNLEGGTEGNAWDDGAFDGVRKVVVGRSGKFVSYVRFEYAKGQRTVPHSHGVRDEAPQEFVVDYPNEHITFVEGTIDGKLTSLKFTTSKGRTSPAFGNRDGRKFVFEKTGFKLVGFCGRSGNVIDALGAHFAPFPAPVPVPTLPYSLTPPNSVSKIYISAGYRGIGEIKFYNVENGQTKERFVHSVKGKDIISTLVINNPPKEYLVSLESWYDSSHVFQGIKFKTDKTGSDSLRYKFSEDDGTPFSIQIKDNKITGFHKLPYSNLNSLPGTYFILNGSSSSPNKLEALGGNDGETFDDGAFDNVRKVYVGLGDSYVAYLKFEYVKKDGKGETHEHGKKTVLGTEVFEVPKEDYITSVKVTYDRVSVLETEVVTSVTFKTFSGITSPSFGEKGQEKGQQPSGNMFFLEGGKITGFHGSSSDVLHSLGAHVYRSPTRMLHGKWIEVNQKGKGIKPRPRCSHAIAMVGDKMYSFGGELTPNFPIDKDKDLYVFDINTRTWSIAPPNGDVPKLPCLGVGMVAIGNKLYVFGGRDSDRNYNGFYSYDTVKSEWKLITPVDKGPEPRSFFSMAGDDENVYVFGGVSKTVRLNTLHAYNIVDEKWSELPNPGESRVARGGAGLAVVQGKIWVVYGFCGDEMDDVHCFDPVESNWTKMETIGEKPWPRSVFALAVVGKYIIISGGEIEMDPQAHLGPGKLDSGAFVLDTESLLWEKLEEGHSPRGWCASTTASLDGKQGLLMYGGKAPTNGRYDDIFFYGVDSA
ncbi:hypothetical protein N665_0775s0002 [Sinapis alba]|nr:hypothetical protein N665_0775s0002 [Sinapis alba]